MIGVRIYARATAYKRLAIVAILNDGIDQINNLAAGAIGLAFAASEGPLLRVALDGVLEV